MYIMGRPYQIDEVNQQLAETWLEIMNVEEEAAKAPTDLIKTPEPFKKDTKWRPWKESFSTYLHSKTGQASIPLAYIIRECDVPLPNVHYPTIHDEIVACAILQGPEYNLNNGIIIDLLQSLTIHGLAWAWISAYERVRDGRNAWKALMAYYEGDSMRTRTKQEYYDAISNASYKGNIHQFDFTSYVAVHQQAHKDLLRLGEPMPEGKKVRDFLQGIMDPQCANIKLNVLANPTYMNDFSQAINYIASAIDLIIKNSIAMQEICQI